MYNARFIRRSWVEIDLNQFKNNLQIYRDYLPATKEIMAVVKADAYGHGDVRMSIELNHLGINMFAVSNIDEAILLRQSGIRGEILVLGYTPLELAGELIKYDITQTLLSEEYAEKLYEISSKIKCQFAVDTGMNRIGLRLFDGKEKCESIIRKYANICNLTGIFTHLCVADSDSETDVSFTNYQISEFENLAKAVSDLNLPYVHCLNSAGGQFYFQNCKYSNIVRLGIVLYGLKPDHNNILCNGVNPILTWKTVVSMIKQISIGESIGYGRAFVSERAMKIATLPTGYADGYNRNLSNIGFVIINGKKAPVVGRICMDQMMVDVSEIDDVKTGDEVILLGEGIDADCMANMIGTIGYDIVCSISKRVPRIYKKKL